MSRLVDYFLVVGYDFEKQRGNTSLGRVLQRFPEVDWTDAPFIEGVEMFCQPLGWRMLSHQPSPSFFMAVLTDVSGRHYYCSCLTFHEEIAHQPIKPPDDADFVDGDEYDVTYEDLSSSSQTTMFVPKCLVFLSQHYLQETFKNSLSVIFSVFVDCKDGPNGGDPNITLEKLVGNLLTKVKVPRSLRQTSFSLGAGDEHRFLPAQSTTVPVTGTCVHRLFEALGIHSCITLFSAVVTEHKILFHSKSYSRLHDACHAITSLMYPFVYTQVYIPLLPSKLFEVLSTPTPFVIGVHSHMKNEVSDILDVIIVDLDGGCIVVPDCVHIAQLDEPTLVDLKHLLCSVIKPSLAYADDAFVSCDQTPSPSHLLDKEIRAIFIRFFCRFLCGYRTCLQTVRIHPKPIITFHKAHFLGQRNMMDNEFVVRVLDSMFFASFVQERGIPFRTCDLFDQLYAVMDPLGELESKDPSLVSKQIKEIAHTLEQAEMYEIKMQETEKVWKPSSDMGNRTFPFLDRQDINDTLEAERIQREMTNTEMETASVSSQDEAKDDGPQVVPLGPSVTMIQDPITNSARRLEVMINCIKCIFENKISDAKKTFPAVLRALKGNSARLALTHELSSHLKRNKPVLEHEQFELLVRLMNCALQQDCDSLGGTAAGTGGHEDVNGLAAAMLPLAMAFSRRLCSNVSQYAYTSIQGHPIWNNLSFWEASFYHNVSHRICSLYMDDGDVNTIPGKGLNIMSTQMKKVYEGTLDKMTIDTLTANEEQALRGEAFHFANWMVALRIPLDVTAHDKPNRLASQAIMEGHSDTNSQVAGGGGRESWRDELRERDNEHNRDEESGFEEDKSGSGGGGSRWCRNEFGINAIKFITRFIEKVSSECELSESLIKRLTDNVNTEVDMQIDTLDSVYKESKKLHPITKPNIILPHLISGEELLLPSGLRVFLIGDGREEANISSRSNSATQAINSGPTLIPSEGAIFVTNYRIIFTGRPVDAYYTECSVVRSFPISTMIREKRINLPANYLISEIDSIIHDGLQIRSNVFQLMRIAFDEEVHSDSIENFRKIINKARSPSDIFTLFAFTSQIATRIQMSYINQQKKKDKSSTLKDFGKTLKHKTAAMTGFQLKTKQKKHKYLMSQIQMNHMMSGRRLSPTNSYDDGRSVDNLSFTSETASRITTPSQMNSPSRTHLPPNGSLKDSREIQKLTELGYVKDFIRLGLGSVKDVQSPSSSSSMYKPLKTGMSSISTDSFRISTINANYGLVSSYPCFLVIPRFINDDCLKKLTRGFRQSRFPIIIWCHRKNKGLLLRGSSFHGKGLSGLVRATAHVGPTPVGPAGAGVITESSHALEQEKYFRSIISLTPSHYTVSRQFPPIPLTSSMEGMITSPPQVLSPIDTSPTKTSTLGRQSSHPSANNPFYKALNTLRNSGGKGTLGTISHSMTKQMSRFTSGSMHQVPPTPPPPHSPGSMDHGDGSILTSSTSSSSLDPSLKHKKSSLYIIVEKSQVKSVKSDTLPNCEFVPVEHHDLKNVKSSFKKLIRACCPASTMTDPDMSFHKMIKQSEWFDQLQCIMNISSIVVDLIDTQAVSVMVCLEEGWDLVPQITSIAQLCLDPYYRTFSGFRTLIEKEWLAFGHRFSHRSNHTAATLTSGFAPIFLQFLDIVHQIMVQFPLSFEFNQYFLKYLAYHYVSCRFRTFLLDCEAERAELGWLIEDLKKSDDFSLEELDFDEDTMSQISGPTSMSSPDKFNFIGTSFWNYTESAWNKSSLFYNFLYEPTNSLEGKSHVIRPLYSMASFKIWDYFTEDNLAHGASYDLEIVRMEQQRREEVEATEQQDVTQKTSRRICNYVYDSVPHAQPSCITFMLDEIRRLEQDLHAPQLSWLQTWNKIEIPMMSQTSLGKSAQTASYHSLSRVGCLSSSAMDSFYSMKPQRSRSGRYPSVLGSNQFMYSHRPHRFDRNAYSKPTQCEHCDTVIFLIGRTGMRCSDCGINCHDKCADQVAKNCPGYTSSNRKSSLQDSPRSPTQSSPNKEINNRMHHDSFNENGNTIDKIKVTETYYDTHDNVSHSGILHKKGHLLKGWKQRFFVLDSIKHQLRFYDMPSTGGKQYKGYIDLADVERVVIPVPTGSSFELITKKRGYSFSAMNSNEANGWVEKINSCLQ